VKPSPHATPLPEGKGARGALLAVDRISAGYGHFDVLQEVSLHALPNEVVAIIGPNGAGKSTVLKTVMGFLKPTAGDVLFEGQSVVGLRADQLVRRSLAYVPQGRVVFQRMTVLENLEMGAFTVRDRKAVAAAMDYVFAIFPQLTERRAQLAGTMSGGEQQMLAVGRALMTRPKMILLDEPSLGLAPKLVDQVFDHIRTLKNEGLAILLVEQNAARALEIAHRGYVLELGRNRYEGLGRELLADERVRKMYLGG
jgi:ABC-type branched-subunit amino acid transport system ATPase component